MQPATLPFSRMKSWVILVAACLLGGCTAEVSFGQNGKVHRYELRAVSLAGISDVSNQFSGVAVRADVLLHKASDDKYAVWMEQVRIASKEDNLDRLEPRYLDWDFQEYSEMAHHLKNVTFVEYDHGKVEKMEIPEDGYVPAVNFQKSIVSLFQLPLTKIEAFLRQNDSLSDEHSLLHYTKDIEPSIAGNCGCHYQFSSENDPSNPNTHVFNMTKIKNYRNCEDEPEWIRTNILPDECDNCESDKAHPLTDNVITDYEIKIKDKVLIIEKILCEGRILLAPLASSADKIEMIHNISLKYMGVEELKQPLRRISNPKKVNITYAFKTIVRHEEDLMNPNLEEPNPTMLYRGDDCKPREAKELLSQAAEILDGSTTVTELRDTPPALTLSVKALQLCDYKELTSFYDYYTPLEDKEKADLIEAKLALIVLKWLGTNPSLLVARDLIVRKAIPENQAAMLLRGMASYQWSKSLPVLKEVKQLCFERAVYESHQLFSSCIMSYGTLIYQACAGESDPVYPTPPSVDKYCSIQEGRSFVQELKKKYDSESSEARKLAIITAIGNAAMKKATSSVLLSIVAEEEEGSDLCQVRATLALSKVAAEYPLEVMDPLLSIATDRTNDIDLRTAAIDAVLYAAREAPSNGTLEKLAMCTWRNDSDQFASYVASTLESISNSTNPCWSALAPSATIAYELLDDDCDGGFFEGTNNFYESDDDELNLASLLQIKYLGEGSSIFPSRAGIKMQRVISQQKLIPFHANLNTNGINSLISQIFGPDAAFDRRDIIEILSDLDNPNENKGLKKIAEALSISPREDDDFEGVLTIRMGQETTQYYYNTKKLLAAVQAYAGDVSELVDLLRHGIPVNYVTARQPVYFKQVMPSELGFPVRVFIRTPWIAAVTGKIMVKGLDALKTRGHIERIQIIVNLKPKYVSQSMMTLGFAVPGKKTLHAAGYDTRVVAAPNAHFDLHLDLEEKLVTLEAIPAQHENEDDTKIIAFRTTPFTATYPYHKIEPVRDHAKPITILDSPRQYTYPILKNLTDNPLVIECTHELFWNPVAKFINDLDSSSLLHLVNFGTLTDKMRMRRCALKWKKANRNQDSLLLAFDWSRVYGPDSIVYNVSSHRGIYTWLTGWGNAPLACDDKNSQRSRSYSSSQPKHQSSSRWQSRQYSEDNEEDNDSNEDDSTDFWAKSQHRRSPRSARYEDARHSEQSWSSPAGHSLRQVVKRFAHGVNKFNIRVDAKLGSRPLCSATLNYTRDLENLYNSWELVAHLDALKEKLGLSKFCAEGEIDYPLPPCHFREQYPGVPNDEIRASLNMSWGMGQCNPSKYIKIQTVAKKSDDQKDYDRAPSTKGIKPWFYEQCDDDRKEGNVKSYACQQRILDESQLNLVKVVIDYNEVPKPVKNATIHAWNWMKYCLYERMSRNAVDVRNKEKQIKIEIEKAVETESVDIRVQMPTVNVHFTKYHYPEILPFMDPPNLRNGIVRRIMDYVSDDQIAPECSLYGNFVTTYTNETYAMSPNNCKYVMARDCSTANLFSVNVIELGQKKKKLEVDVLQHKIEIDATDSNEPVKIDGEVVRLPEHHKAILHHPVHHKIVAFVVRTSPVFNVILPYHGVRVKYDQQNVVVKTSHIYTGRVCGLCGDMDSETPEYVGPQECEYAEVDDFVASWAVPTSGCSRPSTSRKQCNSETRNTRVSYSPQKSYSSRSEDTCEVVRKHLIVTRPERRDSACFSVEPVRQCSSGCRPVDKEPVKVPMHCIEPTEPKAKELMGKAKRGNALPELRSKKIDVEIKHELPKRCVSDNY